MEKIVIAIDGHAGCGKSTTAKLVAKRLGYLYIDSGAMYRAVTLHFLRQGVDPSKEKSLDKELSSIHLHFENEQSTGKSEIHLNQENVAEEIRGMEVSEKVSEVSALPEVREYLVAEQRRMGQAKGIVMDGRDIGTVVFADAELKVFMTADLETRAKRRQAELGLKGEEIPLESIIENLKKRDDVDSNRKLSPLKKAVDALKIDTSNLSIAQQVDMVVALAKERIAQNG